MDLKLRKNGIGGSDAPAVVGVSPYSTPLDVYLDKTSFNTKKEENSRMFLGKALEQHVIHQFTKETGLNVEKMATRFHSKHEFMLGNIDGFIHKNKSILECKTTFNPFGELARNKVPDNYMVQVQHYLKVFELDHAYLAALIIDLNPNRNLQFKLFEIERDTALVERLVEIESHFWNEYVIPKITPPLNYTHPKAAEILSYLYPHSIPQYIKIEDSHNKKIQRWEELKEETKEKNKEIEAIEAELKDILKDSETGICGSFYIDWKSLTSKRIDQNFLKKTYPEVYENCCKESTYRRFTIKNKIQKNEENKQ